MKMKVRAGEDIHWVESPEALKERLTAWDGVENEFCLSDAEETFCLSALLSVEADDGNGYSIEYTEATHKGVLWFARAEGALPDIQWVQKVFTDCLTDGGHWRERHKWEKVSDGKLLKSVLFTVVVVIVLLMLYPLLA